MFLTNILEFIYSCIYKVSNSEGKDLVDNSDGKILVDGSEGKYFMHISVGSNLATQSVINRAAPETTGMKNNVEQLTGEWSLTKHETEKVLMQAMMKEMKGQMTELRDTMRVIKDEKSQKSPD